jgi:hypothetical protein
MKPEIAKQIFEDWFIKFLDEAAKHGSEEFLEAFGPSSGTTVTFSSG